jgi:hypothetical protein
MKYFDFNDNEITEAEYNTRVAAGKRFTMRGNRLIRQMSPATEEQRDKDEKEYKANNPQTLDAFKANKINKISKNVSTKYSFYVDKYYQKKFRREQAGVDYTIPEAVASYVSTLESFFDDFKDAVNACTTQEQCELVRPGHNGHAGFPDESNVKE